MADGLPLFGGAIGNGEAQRTLTGSLQLLGTKETTYPELIGPNARCRLVFLAGEMGGRWSEETRSFVGLLAKAVEKSFGS